MLACQGPQGCWCYTGFFLSARSPSGLRMPCRHLAPWPLPRMPALVLLNRLSAQAQPHGCDSL